MIEGPLRDLINYRREKAWETLDEAHLLAQNGHYSASVNRMYYACFYMVNALLVMHGRSAVKHSGVRSIFNRDYVHSGIIPTEIAIVYNELFTLRQESDYEDFFTIDTGTVEPLLIKASTFLKFIEKLIIDS